MAKKELHPTIEKFKQFVKNNPSMIQKVRNEECTWQELYEDWYLLGEEDPRWDEFRGGDKKNPTTTAPTAESKTDWISQIMGAVKKMDAQQFEGHINNLSQALAAIQGVVSQFQGGNNSNPIPKNEQKTPHPFKFRKD